METKDDVGFKFDDEGDDDDDSTKFTDFYRLTTQGKLLGKSDPA